MNPSAPPNIYPTIPPHPNYQAPPYPQQPGIPQNQYPAPQYPANQQLPYQQHPQQQNFPYQQQPPQQQTPYPQQPPNLPYPQQQGNYPNTQQPGNFPNTQQPGYPHPPGVSSNPQQPPAVPPRQNSLAQTSGNPGNQNESLGSEMQKLEVSENKDAEKQKKIKKLKKVIKNLELKCKSLKSGQVEYGKSYTAMAGDCSQWFNYFVELSHDGKLKLSTYCKETEEIIQESFLIIDKDWYACVQNKKYVCLQYKDILHVLKPKTELLCEKWLHALGDYATAGPAMSGYVEKFQHNKGKYKKYFLRLKSNSSLDWFSDHFEAESTILAVDCIQVRGTKSNYDSDAPKVVAIAAGKKNYKFRFKSASEANTWLKAFQYYSDKKPLKSVKFKNSA